jgi:hypothetical protein
MIPAVDRPRTHPCRRSPRTIRAPVGVTPAATTPPLPAATSLRRGSVSLAPDPRRWCRITARQAASRRSISRTHARVSRTAVSPVKPQSMLSMNSEPPSTLPFSSRGAEIVSRRAPRAGTPLELWHLDARDPVRELLRPQRLPQNQVGLRHRRSYVRGVFAACLRLLRHLRQATQKRIHLADVRQFHRLPGEYQADRLRDVLDLDRRRPIGGASNRVTPGVTAANAPLELRDVECRQDREDEQGAGSMGSPLVGSGARGRRTPVPGPRSTRRGDSRNPSPPPVRPLRESLARLSYAARASRFPAS